MSVFDVIIVGAGPAGLAAALDAQYLKLKTLVIDADKAGGAMKDERFPKEGSDYCIYRITWNVGLARFSETAVASLKDIAT